ncbi:MAG: extracellular solute-binding protein [Thaumarchaeota archaeon]|nr:extracellular solute-binding protein [Nitrososphaerota archaeon]
MDLSRIGLGLSLLALVSAVGSIAYVNQTLGGIPSQLSTIENNQKQSEQRLAAIEAAQKQTEQNIRGVAAATGVPLGETEALQRQIDFRKLITDAEREGKVVFYALSQDVPPALAKAFQSKYPKITVDYLGGHGATLAKKFRDETSAGVPSADVINLSADMPPLKKDGLLLKYSPPEVSIYPSELKDPDGYYASLRQTLTGVVAYNTKVIPKDQAPKTWDDLLDPKWKGKIGIPDGKLGGGNLVWLMARYVQLGENEATFKVWLQRFAANQPRIVSGGSGNIEPLLVVGEFPIAIANPHNIEQSKQQGAPVDWVPSIRAVKEVYWIGLSKTASHPNAAKLFLSWALGDEGQRVLAGINHIPSRPGIPPELKTLAGEGYAFISSEYRDSHDAQFRKLFEDIVLGQK